jgi:hypothetical protein
MTQVGSQQLTPEWVARLAIQDLIVRFSDAVTRRDWNQFEAVWAPQGIWEVAEPTAMREEGAGQIRRTVEEALSGFEFWVQMAHGSVVTVTADGRASATSTIQEMGRSRDGATSLVLFGVYHDELILDADGWRFTHRRFQPIYIESGPLLGQAISSDAE